uniref:FGFR1 oncogene partner 2 n=1 Tax=Lygus hesperus TaxID=30085 RepID=A0A0A9XYV0_LYGHE
MSLTIHQIVLDAKNLAVKLKESNSTADNLLSQGQTVHRQIDIMKQYSDDVGELNEAARHRPHTALVAGIKQENRHLRDLQQENRELKAALEEQQNALELIMTKYRQQMTKLVNNSKLDLPKLYSQRYHEKILEQGIKIKEMAEVMSKAANIDDDAITKDQEELTRLSTENKGLRQLLQIATENGSVDNIFTTT